jgi:hypothetical protein
VNDKPEYLLESEEAGKRPARGPPCHQHGHIMQLYGIMRPADIRGWWRETAGSLMTETDCVGAWSSLCWCSLVVSAKRSS